MLERGAFSDKEVVKASKHIVPILVDCDWGKKNTDISGKYGVKGYPTVVFTDPAGEVVDRLGSREPSAVANQITKLAKKFPGRDIAMPEVELPFEKSYDAAVARAKKESKPMLVLLTDGSDRAGSIEAALASKELLPLLEKFVLVRHEIEKDCPVCEQHKVTTGGHIHVIDFSEEDPYARPAVRLTGSPSTSRIESALERALPKSDDRRDL